VKLLTALASVATLILFVAVAATSPATPTVFGVIGALCGFVLIPMILVIGAAANGVRPGGRRVWLGRLCLGTAVIAVVVGVLTLLSGPAHFLDTSPFATGLLGASTVGLFVGYIIWAWWKEHYRPCPECKATIKSDASHCRHCTAEVPVLKLELPRPVSAAAVGRSTPAPATSSAMSIELLVADAVG
jgi:hypothetical protein